LGGGKFHFNVDRKVKPEKKDAFSNLSGFMDRALLIIISQLKLVGNKAYFALSLQNTLN